jgi:hypothetical protein
MISQSNYEKVEDLFMKLTSGQASNIATARKVFESTQELTIDESKYLNILLALGADSNSGLYNSIRARGEEED